MKDVRVGDNIPKNIYDNTINKRNKYLNENIYTSTNIYHFGSFCIKTPTIETSMIRSTISNVSITAKPTRSK